VIEPHENARDFKEPFWLATRWDSAGAIAGRSRLGRLSAARLPCPWQKENDNFNHEDLIEPEQI
jgi:hypothetical protein